MIWTVLMAAATLAAPAEARDYWSPRLIGASVDQVRKLVPTATGGSVKAQDKYPGQAALRAKDITVAGMSFDASFAFLHDRLIGATLYGRDMRPGETDANIARVQALVEVIRQTRGPGQCIDGRRGERFDGTIDTSMRDEGWILYLCIWKKGRSELTINYIDSAPMPPRLEVKLRDTTADWRIYATSLFATPAAPSSEP